MFDLIRNSKTTPGFKPVVYFALKEDIDTWPTKAANSNKFTTDFAMAAGKVWGKLQVSQEPGEVTVAQEQSGNSDNPTSSETVNIFTPGIDGDASYNLDSIKGKEVIFLMPDADNCKDDGDDIYRVVGTECNGVFIRSVHANDGTKKGYTITGTAYNTGLPWLYSGAIVTS